jgi:hypothetical protein
MGGPSHRSVWGGRTHPRPNEGGSSHPLAKMATPIILFLIIIIFFKKKKEEGKKVSNGPIRLENYRVVSFFWFW